jgi:nicotinate-nucleotide pyrophosphorylase
VRAYADAGVDFISVGALTPSTVAADMSLRVTPV